MWEFNTISVNEMSRYGIADLNGDKRSGILFFKSEGKCIFGH